MFREQNLSSTFPNVRFTNIRPFCGLFGLYGLEGQTDNIGWVFYAIWSYNGKKIHKKSFFCYLVFDVAFKIFFGLFHFFWDISCLRSLLGCNNPISKLIIIPKGKWFKFLISNHSEIQVFSYHHCGKILKERHCSAVNRLQRWNIGFVHIKGKF